MIYFCLLIIVHIAFPKWLTSTWPTDKIVLHVASMQNKGNLKSMQILQDDDDDDQLDMQQL